MDIAAVTRRNSIIYSQVDVHASYRPIDDHDAEMAQVLASLVRLKLRTALIGRML